MPCYVGLDTSLRHTSVCIIDKAGRVVKEGQVETTPKALVEFLRGDRRRYAAVGMETGALSAWLCRGLKRAGLPVASIDARHAHGALKTQPNKTDRADARGIAQLMRTGSFKAVHLKSLESSTARGLLTSRRLLIAKLRDLQNGVRGLLLAFGLKLPHGQVFGFEKRVLGFVRNHKEAATVVRSLMTVCSAVVKEIAALNACLAQLAAEDPVCRLLTSAPGIGPLTALMFRSAIDQPERFSKSRTVGPMLGLTPRTHQSGEIERRGRISKCGDAEVQAALYMAAWTLMRSNSRRSWLKDWGEELAARRGRKRAGVAIARRLAVVLHRMWVTNTPFRWERPA